MEAAPHEPPEKLVAFQDETQVQTQAAPRLAARFPGPSATSTPMPKSQEEPKPRQPRQPPKVK
jgi:hypothetical protein